MKLFIKKSIYKSLTFFTGALVGGFLNLDRYIGIYEAAPQGTRNILYCNDGA